MIRIRNCTFAGPEHAAIVAAVYGSTRRVPNQITPAENLSEFLVAFQNDIPVACVAIYHNRQLRHKGKPTIQLGAFESISDHEVVKALLDAACERSAKWNAAYALGPLDGSTWNEYRFITGSNGQPRFLTEMQHPDYYPPLWQQAGFKPVSDYVSNIAPLEPRLTDPNFFDAHRLQVGSLDLNDLRTELEKVYPLCSAAFSKSPYFSPISAELFVEKLMPLKPLLGGSFTRIVRNEGGVPIAFVLCLPDLLDASKKQLVIKTIAKSPACKIAGLISILSQNVLNEAWELGYREVIHAFMHSSNRSVERSREFAGRTIRNYALFARTC
jgi:hypothetical protein